MIDVGPVLTIELPLNTYHRGFLRTDKREKRSPRGTPYHVYMLRRWAERLVEREAARLGAGVAYTSPTVEVERRADLRGTEFLVYIDAAFIPDHPRTRLIVEPSRHSISIPVLAGVTAHD